MSQSAESVCPHCGSRNPAAAVFCQSCGRALPSAESAAPIVMTESQTASGAPGRTLQAAESRRRARRAASAALMTISVLASIALLIVAGFGIAVADRHPEVYVVIIAVAVITAGYWALYAWSLRNPFPAAIVAFVVFSTLAIVGDVGTYMRPDPNFDLQDRPPGYVEGYRAGRTSTLIIEITIQLAIISFLLRAIKLGSLHRRLITLQRQTVAASTGAISA